MDGDGSLLVRGPAEVAIGGGYIPGCETRGLVV